VTVGFHSPLPPARSGVADYAAALLRALREFGSVEPDAATADVHLYHLGNNPLHADAYRRAMDTPGVAVLHDAVLHHFFLGALDRADYVDEFVYQYGEWHRPLAERLWLERAGSAQDHRYFAYPMLKRIAERSRAVIVHNAAAAAMVQSHAPDAAVVQIPHLFEGPREGIAPDTFRQKLGIPADATLFGVFGYLRESKRVLPVLETFARVRAGGSRVALLLAGEFASADLHSAVRPWLDKAGVFHTGHLSEQDFWLAAEAVDVCINLRDPGAGETSGIAIRLMGIGKPVMLTDGLETAGFPDAACLRVRRGVAETAELFEYMSLAVAKPYILRQVGGLARRHIRERHSLQQAAQEYWSTLCRYRK